MTGQMLLDLIRLYAEMLGLDPVLVRRLRPDDLLGVYRDDGVLVEITARGEGPLWRSPMLPRKWT